METNTSLDQDLMTKIKVIIAGPDRDLFTGIVKMLFDRCGDYQDQVLSDEDKAAIQRGKEQIQQGECLTLEEYRQGKRL
ncbi:MAG: hypothetical protein JRI57_10810 [Deltaproteobacteria bacterium]|nr:hypothetical protein [Deltaproteobacteria bacterium]MBW1953688.1 hypothetical protein [Deltaproteobacteria bacterium]MBW1987764.1 hypothetical protein [Deltaproteobacteria bacterium]MBW2135769.1 hypothetical protein [Deltaproteobacteria bacterium]